MKESVIKSKNCVLSTSPTQIQLRHNQVNQEPTRSGYRLLQSTNLPAIKHLYSLREISGAFGRFFASSLSIDNDLPTSYPPCMTSKIFVTVSFLPKMMAPLLEKPNVSYHPGPDSLPTATFTLGGVTFEYRWKTCSNFLSNAAFFPPDGLLL